MDPVLSRVAKALALVAIAAAAGWGLHWLRRRAPAWLARRRGVADVPAFRHGLGLVLLAPQLAILVVVLWKVIDLFDALRDVRMSVLELVKRGLSSSVFTVDMHGYTALDVLELPVLLAGLWLGVQALTWLLRRYVLRSVGADRGVEETIVGIVRYALLFLGGVIVLKAWGLDVGSLAIAGGVLGVGVGFGLQNIANNFVSGVVIGLERPYKIGDFVKVGEFLGTVERVGARSTEIRTLDRVSIVVPNSRFLEQEVVNWSLGDPVSRVHVPVSVAYGSDVDSVRATLLEAARSHPCVLADPAPQVQLVRFGESALDFELLVWTHDPRNQFTLRSDLNYRVEANLRRHDLTIPFPQRELRLSASQLDALLDVMGGRPVPATVGDTPRSTTPPLSEIPAELAPRAWSDAGLRELVDRMRGTGGVEVTDRRHLLKLHPRCFVGCEAVDWLVRSEGIAREQAVRLGRRLAARGELRHVLDEHPFEDGRLFYRFRADEAT